MNRGGSSFRQMGYFERHQLRFTQSISKLETEQRELNRDSKKKRVNCAAHGSIDDLGDSKDIDYLAWVT